MLKRLCRDFAAASASAALFLMPVQSSAQPPEPGSPQAEAIKRAFPPGTTSDQIGELFRNLGKGKGVDCCDVADCRIADFRHVSGYGDDYKVYVDHEIWDQSTSGNLKAQWMAVDPDHIIDRKDLRARGFKNLPDEAIACANDYEVTCFLPPLTLTQDEAPWIVRFKNG